MCFYRRSEIPSSLVPIADKHHWGEADMEQDSDDEDAEAKNENCEKALLKSREVFLSRQTETLPHDPTFPSTRIVKGLSLV